MYHHHHHHHQGNNLLSYKPAFHQERHLFPQGTNVPGDPGLVLSTDAKPRLKWTAELHERFIDAVNQLGGADKATPKTVMRLMGIPGLTLYHLKSHLQKYRLSKNLQPQASNGPAKNAIGCMLTPDRTSEVNQSLTTSVNNGPQTNKTMQISEALQMQIEVQRHLHEQLEVQRHLQLRIEAQGKYLQSVLEKAQETLGKQNLGSIGLETAKVQLSELASRVSTESLGNAFSHLQEYPNLHNLEAETAELAGCSVSSCLTSCDISPADRGAHKVSLCKRIHHGNSEVCMQKLRDDSRFGCVQSAMSEEVDCRPFSFMVKDSDRKFQRDTSILSMTLKTEAQQRESNEESYIDQPNRKRPAVPHEVEKQSKKFRSPFLTAQLDLNSHNSDGVPGICKEFDLNGLG